jgi:hypothetical protein
MSLPESESYSVARHDVIALLSGLLVFVASFLPWYSVTFGGGPAETGVTGTVNAWHGLAGIGLILLLFSLVVTAAEPYFGDDRSTPLPASIAASVLACVGALFVVIRSLDLPSVAVPGASVGLRWGGWVLIVLVVVQALISVLRVVHAGDRDR